MNISFSAPIAQRTYPGPANSDASYAATKWPPAGIRNYHSAFFAQLFANFISADHRIHRQEENSIFSDVGLIYPSVDADMPELSCYQEKWLINQYFLRIIQHCLNKPGVLAQRLGYLFCSITRFVILEFSEAPFRFGNHRAGNTEDITVLKLEERFN